MITRRYMLLGGSAGVAAGALALHGAPAQAAQTYPLTLTDVQWKSRLTPDAYVVLRKAGTEEPFTSPLLKEHRPGVFNCAGCQLDLFSSKTKFESGTGWPSFWAPITKSAVEIKEDYSFNMERQAVNCSRCGGHLGHVFPDGPKPTGLRYCMNGVALGFKPGAV